MRNYNKYLYKDNIPQIKEDINNGLIKDEEVININGIECIVRVYPKRFTVDNGENTTKQLRYK